MKIATLSKFDTVSMITTLEDDDFLEYHGTYPSLERTKEDINNRYGLENNPSSTPPSTVNMVEMVSIMKEITCQHGLVAGHLELLYYLGQGK